jgi:rSAM/selenodomain-associated transferase 1
VNPADPLARASDARSLEKLIIFLKAPRPGLVKTRLAAVIGPQAACVAYRKLVELLLDQLRELPFVELKHSPDDATSEIAPWLAADWNCRPQGSGDLGERLRAAFDDAFAQGAERVAVIGSDCPYVTPEDIRAAWSALSRCDVVLGPAGDGGYWLIGLRRVQPELFHDIPWSTDQVLHATMTRIQSAGLSVHLLRTLEDVDTEADWRRFLARRL